MSVNHIIKTQDDRLLYFFQNKGLCVKDLLRPNEGYKRIYENAVFDFDVLEIENTGLGIICQDDKGSIIFLRENENSYLKTTLLSNRSQVAYEKHFKLLSHSNWISIIYVIHYQGRAMLSHQIANEENAPPSVIDYIEEPHIYSFVNKSRDILTFYNTEGNFGYRIYKWSKKEWEGFIHLGQGELITAMHDRDDNVYIIHKSEEQYAIKILKLTEFNYEIIDRDIDFIRQGDEINMVMENDSLWILLNRDNFIFGVKTDRECESFSNIYNFMNDDKIILYDVTINEMEYCLTKCFGYERNLFPKLILYKNLFDFSRTLKIPEISIEGSEVEELAEISRREEPTKSMKELTKLTIRLKALEDTVKQLQNIVDSFENKREINNSEADAESQIST